MLVKVISFAHSNRPTVLASVRIEFGIENISDSIIIDDARVLRNKQGQLWLAMPSYSIATADSRAYEYLPAVVLSAKLKRDVEDAVLAAFEAWQRQAVGGAA